jgi:hypothetical protein
MKYLNYIICMAIMASLVLSGCVNKPKHGTNSDDTGFTDSIDLEARRESTGFDEKSDSTKYEKPVNFLSGCYEGTMEGIEAGSPNVALYIDARGLDTNGWQIAPEVKLAVKGNFDHSFNLTSNDCIGFNTPTTNQTAEYWEKDGLKGVNMSLDLGGITNGGVGNSVNDTCQMFGSPIRLDVRLIFDDNNEGTTGPVNAMHGSFILYYANIQKAFIRLGDPRAENPRYCCSEEWAGSSIDPSEICSEDVTLDRHKDLSYYMGRVHFISADLTCKIQTTCSQ